MQQIIILEEKHGTYYLDASTPELLGKHCLDIIKARSHWYEDDIVTGILKRQDAKAALRFLENRADHEYEGFELELVQDQYKG